MWEGEAWEGEVGALDETGVGKQLPDMLLGQHGCWDPRLL